MATDKKNQSGSEGIGWPHNRAVADALQRSLDSARTPRSQKKVRSIIMLSGGMDSVALLANVLAETDQIVHAHHIEIDNYEGRMEAEIRATDRVVEYCRKRYRDFEYSRSRYEFPLGMGGGTDMDLALFFAARVTKALRGGIDIVYTGHVVSTFWELSAGASIFNSIFINRKFKPEWLRPLGKLKSHYSMRKVDIYESMPKKLASLTWSCRKPIKSGRGFKICGKCHACKTQIKLAEAVKDRKATPAPSG